MSEIRQHLKTILISFYSILKVIFRNWHIRKVLNFSNFLKLCFLYSVFLIWIILFEIDSQAERHAEIARVRATLPSDMTVNATSIEHGTVVSHTEHSLLSSMCLVSIKVPLHEAQKIVDAMINSRSKQE